MAETDAFRPDRRAPAAPPRPAPPDRRRRPRRGGRRAARLPVLLLALLALVAGAQEAPDAAAGAAPALDDAVARLTVIPAGEQRFDLVTGVTTLPDGGTIVDQETGLTLEADHVRYREGAYIEARDAVADTEAGRITAPVLRIDVPALTAVATEGVAFSRPGMRVEADAAEYRFDDELVRFEAPVGTDPVLEARALLLAVDSGDALLLGPYRYQQGLFTLSDEREDAALQLRPVVSEDGTPGYRAANDVDPDLWARVAPLR